MKKLLLIILLLTGCAREYECAVGTYSDDGEFNSLGGFGDILNEDSTNLETSSQKEFSATLDWPDGPKEARQQCEATYNDGETEKFHCICEESN